MVGICLHEMETWSSLVLRSGFGEFGLQGLGYFLYGYEPKP